MDTTNFKPGDIIGGRYRILGILGIGGMGTVYEAEHLATLGRVAIKFLNSPDHVQNLRLIQEAQTLAKLDNRYVVSVSDGDVSGPGPSWIVMKLLRGHSLRYLLHHLGALGVWRTLHYTLQIAEGVLAAHDIQVVHRDLKPENVFIIEPEDEVRVLDFGMAKTLSGTSNVPNTEPMQVLGTPAYVPPERMLLSLNDHRGDGYSLGVMIFEMVMGRHPYAIGPGPLDFAEDCDLGYKHIYEIVPPLHVIDPTIPVCVSNLVCRLLAKNVNARLPMVEVVEQVRACLKFLEHERQGTPVPQALLDVLDRASRPLLPDENLAEAGRTRMESAAHSSLTAGRKQSAATKKAVGNAGPWSPRPGSWTPELWVPGAPPSGAAPKAAESLRPAQRRQLPAEQAPLQSTGRLESENPEPPIPARLLFGEAAPRDFGARPPVGQPRLRPASDPAVIPGLVVATEPVVAGGKSPAPSSTPTTSGKEVGPLRNAQANGRTPAPPSAERILVTQPLDLSMLRPPKGTEPTAGNTAPLPRVGPPPSAVPVAPKVQPQPPPAPPPQANIQPEAVAPRMFGADAFSAHSGPRRNAFLGVLVLVGGAADKTRVSAAIWNLCLSRDGALFRLAREIAIGAAFASEEQIAELRNRLCQLADGNTEHQDTGRRLSAFASQAMVAYFRVNDPLKGPPQWLAFAYGLCRLLPPASVQTGANEVFCALANCTNKQLKTVEASLGSVAVAPVQCRQTILDCLGLLGHEDPNVRDAACDSLDKWVTTMTGEPSGAPLEAKGEATRAQGAPLQPEPKRPRTNPPTTKQPAPEQKARPVTAPRTPAPPAAAAVRTELPLEPKASARVAAPPEGVAAAVFPRFGAPGTGIEAEREAVAAAAGTFTTRWSWFVRVWYLRSARTRQVIVAALAIVNISLAVLMGLTGLSRMGLYGHDGGRTEASTLPAQAELLPKPQPMVRGASPVAPSAHPAPVVSAQPGPTGSGASAIRPTEGQSKDQSPKVEPLVVPVVAPVQSAPAPKPAASASAPKPMATAPEGTLRPAKVGTTGASANTVARPAASAARTPRPAAAASARKTTTSPLSPYHAFDEDENLRNDVLLIPVR